MNRTLASLLTVCCLSICLSCEKSSNKTVSEKALAPTAESINTEQLIRNAYAAQKEVNSPAMSALKQKVKDDLNRESIIKIIIEAIGKREQRQFSPEDVSVTLSEVTLHHTDSSGMPQIFIIVKCFIKGTGQIVGMEKNIRGDILRTYNDNDRVDMLVGPIDIEKHVFKVWGAFSKGAEPDLRFIDLRKDGPEYILLGVKDSGESHCEDCDPPQQEDTIVIGFDQKEKMFRELLRVHSYLLVATSGPSYQEWSNIEWSDWINGKYRELIVTTTRLGTETAFTDRKEIYILDDQQSLFLAVRIDDGKVVINNRVDGRLFELKQLGDGLSKQPTGTQK